MIFLYNSSSYLLLVAILCKILQPGGGFVYFCISTQIYAFFFIALPLKCISNSVIVNGKLGISGASHH